MTFVLTTEILLLHTDKAASQAAWSVLPLLSSIADQVKDCLVADWVVKLAPLIAVLIWLAGFVSGCFACLCYGILGPARRETRRHPVGQRHRLAEPHPDRRVRRVLAVGRRQDRQLDDAVAWSFGCVGEF